jgi:hypothetical protein
LINQGWKDKVSNTAQLGGIETSVIDNGPGRGTRIAWINTGAGLRFKVVLDRAMDIADTFYNQHSIAWLSHVGITSPEPFSNSELDWLKTFGGGLLTTCGLSHVGGPEADEFGKRGIHGEISNLAAEIESIIQPDPLVGKMEMSITGRMKETQALGPNLELRRTISATLGESTIRIHDEVLNRGISRLHTCCSIISILAGHWWMREPASSGRGNGNPGKATVMQFLIMKIIFTYVRRY